MNGSESHGYAQFSIKAGRVPIFMMPGRRSSNLHFHSQWISIKSSFHNFINWSERRKFTWTRRILCIGVKWSSASACSPTWSRVERVRVSQMFLAGHHKAWSDQSFGFAAMRKRKMKTLIICVPWRWLLMTQFSHPLKVAFYVPGKMSEPLNSHKNSFAGSFHGVEKEFPVPSFTKSRRSTA